MVQEICLFHDEWGVQENSCRSMCICSEISWWEIHYSLIICQWYVNCRTKCRHDLKTNRGIVKDIWHERFGYWKTYLGDEDLTRKESRQTMTITGKIYWTNVRKVQYEIFKASLYSTCWTFQIKQEVLSIYRERKQWYVNHSTFTDSWKFDVRYGVYMLWCTPWLELIVFS